MLIIMGFSQCAAGDAACLYANVSGRCDHLPGRTSDKSRMKEKEFP